jgi:hypothetical protein
VAGYHNSKRRGTAIVLQALTRDVPLDSRIVANPSVTAICLTSGACKKLFGQDLVFEHEVPANITVGVLAFFAQDNPLRGRDAALEENSSMIWQS